jgi:hypothetical protein
MATPNWKIPIMSVIMIGEMIANSIAETPSSFLSVQQNRERILEISERNSAGPGNSWHRHTGTNFLDF